MKQVRSQDPHLTGQRVDCDLRAGRAVGEVEERTSLRPETIPMDLRRLVMARMRQLHARQSARFGKLAEAHGNVAGKHARVAELDRLRRDVPSLGGKSRHPL